MFRHLGKLVCTGITELSTHTWLTFTFTGYWVA
jgi:hypothetical protein